MRKTRYAEPSGGLTVDQITGGIQVKQRVNNTLPFKESFLKMREMFEQSVRSWILMTCHGSRVRFITTSPDSVDQMGLLMSVGRNIGDKARFSSIDDETGA